MYKNKLYAVEPIKDLKEMLDKCSKNFGERPAFLFKPENLDSYRPVTHKEFKLQVDALGTRLLKMGLKNKRIAIISENRYEWAVSYLAVLNGIGVAVPIDKDLPGREIKNLIGLSKANAVIFSEKYREIFSDLSDLPEVEHFISMDTGVDINTEELTNGTFYAFNDLLSLGGEELQKGDIAYLEQSIDREGMSVLLFTSGTTSTAKGVMLSHKNIAENLMAMCSMLYIRQEDIFLSVLPLHHTYECTCGFLCPIYRGAAVAYCEGLRHIPKNLKEAQASVMLAVPLIYESIYKKIWENARAKGAEGKLKKALAISNLLRKVGIDLTKIFFKDIHQALGGAVRILISGAAGVDPEVSRGFRGFGILFVQGYGLTECSPIVALNRDCDFKDDAAGLPLPGIELKIFQPNEEGIGEIACKGESIMLGYYENEDDTRKVIRDGWFYTGDMGYVDGEGFVHITGRKKNVIITKNGKNVYPEELEEYLIKSRYIAECVVAAEEEENDSICAHIFPNYEKLREEGVESEEQIRDVLQHEISIMNRELPIYKKITKMRIRSEEFVKTTTRKIKRYTLK